MTGVPSPDMASARLRIGRAKAHMLQLLEELGRYMSEGPFSAVADESADGSGLYAYRLRVDPPPPQHWSLLLGDAVHNARAALDYAVVAMATASAGRDLTDEQARHLQFPLLIERPEDFGDLMTTPPRTRGKKTGRLWGLQDVFVERVEKVQPYNGWRYAWPDDERLAESTVGTGNFLARLDRLSNQEKHRRLALMTADMRGGYIASSADSATGLSVLAWAGAGCPPLVEGSVLATAPARDVAHTIAPAAVIAVEDEAAGRPLPVDSLLPAVVADVSHVLSFLATGEALGPDWE